MNITKQGLSNFKDYVEFDCINPNIQINSVTMPLGTSDVSTGTWRTAGSNSMTRSRVLIKDNLYGFQNSGIQTPNDGSCYGIDSFPFIANEDYVFSMYARITSGTFGLAGFAFSNLGSDRIIGGSHVRYEKNYYVTPLTSNWTRCWIHIKNSGVTSRSIYIGIVTGETSVTTQMCKIKIESGSRLTPWIPNVDDPEYSSFPSMRITEMGNEVITNNFTEL